MGRETIKSADTRDSYLYNLGLVCQRFGCTPDELVAQRIKDLVEQEFTQRERLEEQIRQFRAELLSQGEGKAFMMVAAVRSFLRANTGVSLNLVNTQPDPEYEVWVYEGEPSGEQVFWQNIVDHAFGYSRAAIVTTLKRAKRANPALFDRLGLVLVGVDSKGEVHQVYPTYATLG